MEHDDSLGWEKITFCASVSVTRLFFYFFCVSLSSSSSSSSSSLFTVHLRSPQNVVLLSDIALSRSLPLADARILVVHESITQHAESGLGRDLRGDSTSLSTRAPLLPRESRASVTSNEGWPPVETR